MSEEKTSPDPKWVGGLVGAVVLALGGGMGSGYALRGTAGANQESRIVDPARVEALERWRAAREALEERDRTERADLTSAIRDSTATNAALREAVVSLNERVKALETRRR